ncbi:hypothetical protein DEU56DRAFT_826784 [Suillus clintonianus]|uniref:uncharacterized protein n=1 Tax=Suillus clintonianus TaxID=1904413 RepID=UPI001B864D70|nr:uncharacterized protein DEU56DRAFT_826784 [Suillus clintonianus]KAG2124648.1 hypothetical protein DEU56DRAFT_826784 [Suillus clintonianus]
MHSLNHSTLLASTQLRTTLPPARLASSSSFDGLVEIVREYVANEKKAMMEAVVPVVIPPIPLRRPNVMSLAHILCSDPAVVLGQVTVEERKDNASAPSSEHTGMEDSSWDEPAASFEDMDVYLNYLDEDEDEVGIVELHSPVQWDTSPVLGWTPPSGCEDVDIGHEDLTCLSQISNTTLHRIPQASDEPEHVPAYPATRPAYVRATPKISTHPPAQLTRTRVVLAPTQCTGVKNKSRNHVAKSRVSCGYGQPPKGGIPPALARDVTKSHALRAEQERKRMRAAAVRAGEGRKPSVLQRASAETEDGMARIC